MGLWPTLHGSLAVAGLLVLWRLLLRSRRAGAASAWLALVLLVLGFASGWSIYPSYRALVKPGLLQHAPRLAWAFEIKEHLALFTLALTVAGVGGLLGAGDGADSAPRPVARVLLLAAGLCGLTVAVIGGLVAA